MLRGQSLQTLLIGNWAQVQGFLAVLKSEEVLELGSTFDEAALALVDTAWEDLKGVLRAESLLGFTF